MRYEHSLETSGPQPCCVGGHEVLLAASHGAGRTQQVFTAGNFVDYSYDAIGQLKTANGKESGGATNRLQEQGL